MKGVLLWVLYEFVDLLLAEKVSRTVKIEASTVEIEERGVKLRLTVVDTPGFADAIDSSMVKFRIGSKLPVLQTFYQMHFPQWSIAILA